MRALLPFFTVLLAGCIFEPMLVPDERATVLPDRTSMAMAETADVTVWVDGAAWRGNPTDLGHVMTPVSVTIENKSPYPVRVAYADFALVGGTGFRYAAIAPMPGRAPVSDLGIEGSEVAFADYHPAAPVRSRPARPWVYRSQPNVQFYVAPHYRYWHPGVSVWSAPFPYDRYYYSQSQWTQQLPTADMLSLALPEGVIQSGGHVQGFIYFQSVNRRETAVQFQVKLIDATTGNAFGTVEIPFNVRGG